MRGDGTSKAPALLVSFQEGVEVDEAMLMLEVLICDLMCW